MKIIMSNNKVNDINLLYSLLKALNREARFTVIVGILEAVFLLFFVESEFNKKKKVTGDVADEIYCTRRNVLFQNKRSPLRVTSLYT